MRSQGGFSPIFITAALSVLVLVAVAGWEMSQSVRATNTNAGVVAGVQAAPTLTATGAGGSGTASAVASTTSPSDPISDIGGAVMQQLEGTYAQMQETGTYSSSTAQMVGQSLAPYVVAQVPYMTFSSGDLKTDADTSYARMLTYRSDLRASLSPLLKNTEPEYEIFAYYVSTGDASYLTKLQNAAQNYFAAASSTARVVVPADAVTYHVAILNAMEEFGATLDAMAAHATDPFASVALLRSYDQAESDMLTSFNSLIAYEKQKQP